MKKEEKRELEQMAMMEVSLECLKLARALEELQNGFINGISGKEVYDILIGSLETIKEITKKSNGIMEVEHKITGEITQIELNLVNPITILLLAIKIKTFLDNFPQVYIEADDEDEIAEFIESFLEIAFDSLLEIQKQLEKKLNEALEEDDK